MKRRTFIQTTAIALAAQGSLPLLAADKEKKKKAKPEKETAKKAGWGNSLNPYVEPCAIEPITGILPEFSPVAGVAMTGAFTAKYDLPTWQHAAEKSVNKLMGSAELAFTPAGFELTEIRNEKDNKTLASTAKTKVEFGKGHTAKKWTQESISKDREDTRFTETGVWDGKRMVVTAKTFSREYATQNPLIHRWGLLPILASGQLKKKPLVFDMLDDSAIRPNQTLSYEGEVEIPVKGGTATVDSYVQTGYGIVPTHYLVDKNGRVQLITLSTVNWVLTG